MGAWLSRLTGSDGEARRTKDEVMAAYAKFKAESEGENEWEKRADATYFTLREWGTTPGEIETGLESVPFIYLGEPQTQQVLAEYIICRDHPELARHKWAKIAIERGLWLLMDDTSELGQKIRSDLASSYRWLRGFVLWTDWIDGPLLSCIERGGKP